MVAGVGGAALFGANAVSAQATGETLVERLATRFNIDQDEVQAVFDEAHEERKADREVRMNERLQLLVDDGTITTEQQAVIEQARSELQATIEEIKPDNFRDLSEEEREAVREQIKGAREAFRQTLADADIDTDEIKIGRGHRGGAGHFGGGHRF